MKPNRTVDALVIIRDYCVETPGQFAHLMWPDSEGWRHSQKVGRNLNGSQRGAGMNKCGGSFLGKLHKAGLIFKASGRYVVTPEGAHRITAAPADHVPAD